MSYLQNKSNALITAANILHTNKIYPAVAHSAYYCCIQLMKHIWLHSLHKTEDDLRNGLAIHNKKARKKRKREKGVHEFLITEIGNHIANNYKHKRDFGRFNNNIWQLKELRNESDYSDNDFDEIKSDDSLMLSGVIVPVLQKY